MARGIAKTATPYVLERDDGLPDREKTVWYIKPAGGFSSVKLAVRYAPAITENRGRREVREGKMMRAEKESWQEVVEKVKNFAFSDDYGPDNGKGNPDYHQEGDPVECEDGTVAYYIKEITDPDVIFDVGKDIPLEWKEEIMEQANKGVVISVADKKKSNSRSTSTSGETTTGRRRQRSTTATPANGEG